MRVQTRIDRILIENKIKGKITNILAMKVSDHGTITCRVKSENQYNMKLYNKIQPEMIKHREFKYKAKEIYEKKKGNGT